MRADVKYYLDKRKQKGAGLFIGPEFHYKYTRTRKTAEFGANCVNGQCAFFRTDTYSELKYETGGLFKFGFVVPLLKKDKRWQLEYNIGFGVKGREFRQTDIPDGYSFVNEPMQRGIFIDYYTPVSPMLGGNLKILFVFLRN